jgi:Cu+-exporting ATPase
MEKASVVADPEQVSVGAIFEAVEKAGYRPVAERKEIGVAGMTCASCVGRVERALRKLPGVMEANVNLATEKASVAYLPQVVEIGEIKEAISKAGYTPRELAADASGEDRERAAREMEIAELKRNVTFAAAFTVPLFLVAMLRYVPGVEGLMLGALPERGWMWIELLLATPVQFYAGWRFYRQGWAEMRHLSPGMSSLVMLGTSAAYFYSLTALLAPQIFPAGSAKTYFEAAGVIITLILLGRLLEAIAKGRTSS